MPVIGVWEKEESGKWPENIKQQCLIISLTGERQIQLKFSKPTQKKKKDNYKENYTLACHGWVAEHSKLK